MRVACLLVAVMAIAVVAPPPARAAGGTATVVIKNDGTYNAEGGFGADFWQIFSASKLENGQVAYTLQKPFDEFFKSNEKYGCAGLDGSDLSDAAYEYVAGLSKLAGREEQVDKLVEFSGEVLAWVRKNWTSPKYYGVKSSGDTLTQEVEPGYYAVRIDFSSSKNGILINAIDGAVQSSIKMEHVSITNEVAKGLNPREEDFKPSVDASFGELVTFRYKTKVQDPYVHSVSSSYPAAVNLDHDVSNSSFTVQPYEITSFTIGGVNYLGVEGITQMMRSDGPRIAIPYEYMNKHQELIGQDVVVTFSAYVNTISGTAGTTISDATANKGNVTLYSNSVDGEGYKEKKRAHADVYSSRIVIDKFTGEYGQPGSSNLAGAKFELRKGENPDAEAYKLYSKEANVYRICDPTVGSWSEAVTQFTTPDSGQVTIEGLGAGEYWLHEVEPPSGFKKLAKPVKIIVKANYDTDSKALTGWEFAYDMGDGSGEKPAVANKVNQEDGSNVIPVLNKKSQGDPLPNTGGMGVVPFLVVGASIVAGGAYWMRSRMVNDR